MVSINGKPIVPMTQSGPPYWRHNLAFNQLYVSAYHLSDANLPAIIERMAAFAAARDRRVHVGGAPDRAVHERSRMERTGPPARGPRQLGDRVRLAARRTSSARSRCKVYNGYSLGEPVCFVSECPEGSMHVSPEYGVIELVESEGGHEIVATGLINDAMPFLRYRTGDLAVPGDGTPCRCGRGCRRSARSSAESTTWS